MTIPGAFPLPFPRIPAVFPVHARPFPFPIPAYIGAGMGMGGTGMESRHDERDNFTVST